MFLFWKIRNVQNKDQHSPNEGRVFGKRQLQLFISEFSSVWKKVFLTLMLFFWKSFLFVSNVWKDWKTLHWMRMKNI